MTIRTKDEARAWRKQFEKVLLVVPDKEASSCAELYPTMKYDGGLIAYKTRINWNGVLKQAAVDLWDMEENNPDNNPDLWNDVEYKNGIRIIPSQIPATNPFGYDELGLWEDGFVYKSKLQTNVYTPAQYPLGWELQENI